MNNLLAKLFIITSLAIVVHAEDKSPWTDESELGIVKVSGNTDSESYSAKQKTTYTFDLNVLSLSGRYLETKAAGIQTAKSWEGAARFDRILTDVWSVFIQQGAESDYFAGYTQRDNSDIGAKYTLIKSETENLFSEFGYRYSKTLSSIVADTKHANYGRFYTEYSRKLNAAVSAKFWLEYLPNFTKSEAYLLNYEPSLSVMLNSMLSLKVAYLVKSHNFTVLPTEKKDDTTFSTALVAKF